MHLANTTRGSRDARDEIINSLRENNKKSTNDINAKAKSKIIETPRLIKYSILSLYHVKQLSLNTSTSKNLARVAADEQNNPGFREFAGESGSDSTKIG